MNQLYRMYLGVLFSSTIILLTFVYLDKESSTHKQFRQTCESVGGQLERNIYGVEHCVIPNTVIKGITIEDLK